MYLSVELLREPGDDCWPLPRSCSSRCCLLHLAWGGLQLPGLSCCSGLVYVCTATGSKDSLSVNTTC
jgi:hypothetical protein